MVVEHSELGSGGTFEFIPPSPRTLRLPHDLFYPFEVEDVQGGGRRLTSSGSEGPTKYLPAVCGLIASVLTATMVIHR